MNMIRKPLAVVLAWLLWWIPLGLHRIVMRQKYWWVHTVFGVLTSAASYRFMHDPRNLDLGLRYIETGIQPSLSQYAHVWLLLVGVPWFLVVIYDQLSVFWWRLPDQSGSAHHD